MAIIGRLLMVLTGFVLALLGVIVFIHGEHYEVGILILCGICSIFGGLPHMSDYNWCHGPKCHTNHTQDRIRGVQGSKVLRTRKIKQNSWNAIITSHTFVVKVVILISYAHWEEFIRLHPRTEALETPIDVKVETRTDYFVIHINKKVIQAIDNA